MSEKHYKFDKARVKAFIKSVEQEILNIKAGESKYRKGAMHFEKGLSGAVNRLDIFQQTPTKKNLDEFLSISKQDFGATVAGAFEIWSAGIYTEVTADEKPVPVERSFETKLQDFYYNLFKIGLIPLSPEQMNRFKLEVDKIAAAIKAEISSDIGKQLEVLVKRLKKKETKPKKKQSPYDASKKKSPAKK